MKKILLIAMTLSFQANAGEVRLTSNHWDNICTVEVVSGKDAPEQGWRTTLSNVQKGFSITRADRLCYRRSNDPDRCDSGLTNWTCDHQMIDGISDLDLR